MNLYLRARLDEIFDAQQQKIKSINVSTRSITCQRCCCRSRVNKRPTINNVRLAINKFNVCTHMFCAHAHIIFGKGHGCGFNENRVSCCNVINLQRSSVFWRFCPLKSPAASCDTKVQPPRFIFGLESGGANSDLFCTCTARIFFRELSSR